MPSSYARYPHLYADQVVFCAADDLWLAPVTGGRAWRLTDDRTPVKHPRFSPDGRHLAWASTRDGQWEVMVMDLATAEPRRLTYWGNATTRVLGWTADGRVLAASAAGEQNLRHVFAKAIDLDGAIERMPYGPVSGVAVHPSGPVVVSTPGSREPAAWKRYRGGTAAKLWLDRSGDAQTYEHLLPEVTAGLVAPLWVGDRLVFASDHEAELPGPADAQANLFSFDPLTDSGVGSLTRHTDHTVAEGYVRDPATDGTRIVYHARGSLYLMDDLDSAPTRIDLSLGAVSGRQPQSLTAAEHIDTVRPDQGGDGSLVGVRGSAYFLSHREGPARALSAESGIRIREPRLLGRTGQAVLVSDVDGEDRLEIHATTADADVRVLAAGGLGRVLSLESDPAGNRVAGISHDGRIWVIDIEGGDVRQVGSSDESEPTDLAFSVDGRYLVWSQPMNDLALHSQLMIIDLSDPQGEATALTSGRFSDTSPSFTADGRYLAFLSARTFDPNYDTHVFNLMFSSAIRPYLIPLAATTPAPFGPSADGWRLSDPSADSGNEGGASTGPEEVVSDVVDLEGFEDRILAFPVPAGHYRELTSAAKGVVWIHEKPTQGVLGSWRAGVEGDEPTDALEFYDFHRRKLVILSAAVDHYAVSGDGQRVIVRSKKAVVVQPADREVKEDDQDRVDVDLSRIRLELDPPQEWRQMFEENARLMRDHYWREDLDGIDWERVVQSYRPVVETLGSHDDLVDLLWEVGAEMNTSHAYVMPQKPPGDQDRKVGMLGADLAVDPDGVWRIDTILPGESSDPDARSPLRAAGVGAVSGDGIVAIDGQPVDPRHGPRASLIGAADKPIEITLRPASGESDRRVVIVPLGDEEAVRYQAWVAGRRAYVEEHGQGKLGYLHIPDMAGPGWAQIHRDIDVATRHQGLIVDVRYNRGGHTSQLVIERLSRKVLGWTQGRHHATLEDYPHQSARGPVIFVANEWSGSDGDIVNAAAQAMELGPVVGVRTWGGVVGIDGRFSLVDGTAVTQPRYAFWLKGYGWDVENHGIDPDIEVVVSPADWHRVDEEDRQLDRAIQEALERLEQTPAAAPPAMSPPRVRRP